MAEISVTKRAMLAGAPPLAPDYAARQGQTALPYLTSHGTFDSGREPVRSAVVRVRSARNPPLSDQLC
jgi:hypothetical protein